MGVTTQAAPQISVSDESLRGAATDSASPEACAPPAECARLADRAIAALIDLAVIGGAFLVIGNWAGERWGGVTATGFELHGAPAAVTLLLTTAFGLVYYWLLEGTWGTTLGKSVMALRVCRIDGQSVGLRRSFTRTAARLVDGIGVYLVGWIVALTSKRRQRLGDHLADTEVVTVPGARGRTVGASILAAWLVAVVCGVVMVRHHGGGASTSAQSANGAAGTPAPSGPAGVARNAASTPGNSMVLASIVLSDQQDGAARSVPFRPGDNVFGAYELRGFTRAPDGRVNVSIRVTPSDPSGAAMADPIESDVNVPNADTGPIRGHFFVTVPVFAQSGTYAVRISAHDVLGSGDATFTPTYVVDAAPLPSAGALEVRDVVFASSDGGEAMSHPTFHAGSQVFAAAKLSGLQFRNDSIDLQMGLALLDPSGAAVVNNDHWGSVHDRFVYHPATFFLPAKVAITLPSPAAPGTYALRFTLTDNVSATTLTYDAPLDVAP
jgi:uncharacterized RDD family membrane protein YckC